MKRRKYASYQNHLNRKGSGLDLVVCNNCGAIQDRFVYYESGGFTLRSKRGVCEKCNKDIEENKS